MVGATILLWEGVFHPFARTGVRLHTCAFRLSDEKVIRRLHVKDGLIEAERCEDRL